MTKYTQKFEFKDFGLICIRALVVFAIMVVFILLFGFIDLPVIVGAVSLAVALIFGILWFLSRNIDKKIDREISKD